MHGQTELARRFEENRERLRTVAYRMLGSLSEADDAVQESWLRLSRADSAEVENLAGWLTTVVARLCLDTLRSRESRQETSASPHDPEPSPERGNAIDPEADVLRTDALGAALLVVLERLGPAERVAFVLHDMFDVPFDEVARVVGRSQVAVRKMASRARRQVEGTPAAPEGGLGPRQEVVNAFLSASRHGHFEALLALLSPDVVLRADALSVLTAASLRWGGEDAPSLPREVRGQRAVAEMLKGRARGMQPALVDGEAGAVWASEGRPQAALLFEIEQGYIVDMDLVMDPACLADLGLTP